MGLGYTLWLVGKSTPRPQSEKIVESPKQVQGYTAGKDTSRPIWRTNTDGCRKRADQVWAEKLGKHQSTTPRAGSRGHHQRPKNDKVLGFLGRPQGHSNEYRWEGSCLNSATRNLHYPTSVTWSKSATDLLLAKPRLERPLGSEATSPRLNQEKE